MTVDHASWGWGYHLAVLGQQQWPDLCTERCRACGQGLLSYEAVQRGWLPVCSACYRQHTHNGLGLDGVTLGLDLAHRLVHGTWPTGGDA